MIKQLLTLGALSALMACTSIVAEGSAKVGLPIAFYEFCEKHPNECVPVGRNTMMQMDAQRWEELETINTSTNRSIRYRSDGNGVDVWSIVGNGGRGDCEEYVLAKRKKLLQLGWPSSALLITFARTLEGRGHALLTVRTNEGNFILDNNTNTIKRYGTTSHIFFFIQSTSNPRKLMRINGLVTS